MKEATLCFLVKGRGGETEVLLGLKKRGFGEGKYNGFGGKVKAGESLEGAVIRELKEETGVSARPEHVRKVGELDFSFPHAPGDGWDQRVHVFVADRWEGEPAESEEMRPAWFDAGSVPFGSMWQDDRHWLPLLLKGKKFRGRFVFKEDNETIHRMELTGADGF